MCSKHVLTLAVTISALACASQPRASRDTQDAAIYAVVLDSLFRSSAVSPRRSIVLNDSTARYRRDELVPEFWTDLHTVANSDSEIVRDFENESRDRKSIAGFDTSLRGAVASPITFATDLDYRRLHEYADSVRKMASPTQFISSADAFWQAFHLSFPDATVSVSLSAIGFSHHGATALVYVEYGCGSLCGEGQIVLLQKTGKDWRISRMRRTWVS